MQATPKIAGNIPRMRGQAMPDVVPEIRESRAVTRRPGALGVHSEALLAS